VRAEHHRTGRYLAMDPDFGDVLERRARRTGQRRKRGGNPRGERRQIVGRGIGERERHDDSGAGSAIGTFYNVRVRPEAFKWI